MSHCNGRRTKAALFSQFVLSTVLLVLQPVAPVNEGGSAVVCVEDTDPGVSRDFNITVTLNVISGTATGQSMDPQMLISSSLVTVVLVWGRD